MRCPIPTRFVVLAVAVPVLALVVGGSALVGRPVGTTPERAGAAEAATLATPAAAAQFVDTVGAPGSYDDRIGARDCALLGRELDAARGCSRRDCVAGAEPGNRNVGAEVCRKRGGNAYATVVDAGTCAALGRVWIAPVNLCASNPDRTRRVIPRAPQCAGARSTYVTLSEREGHYDECRAPSALRSIAGRDRAPEQQAGGVLVVGASITWRGSDELAGRAPTWTVDGYPGRRLTELAGRLEHYATGHEPPTGLVLELGTNPSPGYTFADLRADLATLPSTTPVMLVAPYRSLEEGRRATSRVARWMRTLAGSRPSTCVADWRRVVMKHPGVLVDGVHPGSVNERPWAEWIASQWERCTSSRSGPVAP